VLMDDLEKIEEGPEDEPEAEIVGDELEETSTEKSHSLLITVMVGVAMLLAGILFGYVGRGQFGPEAQAAKSTATAQAVAAATQTAANAELSATQAAANADLMKFLTENTRHYKGDPNAAVTIIEFSDFQ
jgi:protein-disulfide isomerase